MDGWEALASTLGEDVEGLAVRQFLILEYLTDVQLPVAPYAQVANDGSALLCEVVSDRYLPARDWPLDEIALRRLGWSPPGEGTDNWWRIEDDPVAVASLIVEGLRRGRHCRDPQEFAWHTGTFPPGPGDGEAVPDPGLGLAPLARVA